MRQFSIAATAAIMLTATPHSRAADGPYLAAGYAVTGFEALCGGDSTFGVVGVSASTAYAASSAGLPSRHASRQ
jgi:hypothetical protein